MKQYHDILRSILEHGSEHQDRTGVGTIAHFGYQTRFDLREGFPIVTTKRVPFRWIAEELFWFLSGDTNEAKGNSLRGDDGKAFAQTKARLITEMRDRADAGPVAMLGAVVKNRTKNVVILSHECRAALPPDVRKGSAFPVRFMCLPFRLIRGLSLESIAERFKPLVTVRHSLTAHQVA